jgi:hypothetical protein
VSPVGTVVVCATCHRARTLGFETNASQFVRLFAAQYVLVLVYSVTDGER